MGFLLGEAQGAQGAREQGPKASPSQPICQGSLAAS